MDNIVDLHSRKKIAALTKHLQELEEISSILKNTIESLTKYDKYSSIKRSVEDMFVLYQDTKRAKQTKLEVLQRLKNE
jgi:hypothetical protein